MVLLVNGSSLLTMLFLVPNNKLPVPLTAEPTTLLAPRIPLPTKLPPATNILPTVSFNDALYQRDLAPLPLPELTLPSIPAPCTSRPSFNCSSIRIKVSLIAIKIVLLSSSLVTLNCFLNASFFAALPPIASLASMCCLTCSLVPYTLLASDCLEVLSETTSASSVNSCHNFLTPFTLLLTELTLSLICSSKVFSSLGLPYSLSRALFRLEANSPLNNVLASTDILSNLAFVVGVSFVSKIIPSYTFLPELFNILSFLLIRPVINLVMPLFSETSLTLAVALGMLILK